MQVLNAAQIEARLAMPRLIECLRDAFRAGHVAPPRQLLPVPGGDGDRLLLTMPAFDSQGACAVKLVTVFPDNRDGVRPTIQGAIVVFANDGSPQALLDAAAITRARTAAASALASTYLSRQDSTHLAIFGTGALAPVMAQAHCMVRPIDRISVWGRRDERVQATIAAIRSRVGPGIEVAAAARSQATREADIISCSTSTTQPIVAGELLRPGAFVDLVGSFSPGKREADDEVVRRARIFVDTFEGALAEAGDVLDPIERGVIDRARIEGELADLATGRVEGRGGDDEICMFKSVGTAIEDFAAARLVLDAAATAPPVAARADRV